MHVQDPGGNIGKHKMRWGTYQEGGKDAVRRAAAKENSPNKNRLADRPKIPHLCKSPLLSAIYPEYPFICGAQTEHFS